MVDTTAGRTGPPNRPTEYVETARVAPGGVPRHELLDRVAYAEKVGARTIYLLGGEPAELLTRIEAYDAWLAKSPDVPKLLMTFEGSPTLLVDERMAAWCAANIASLETVHCGEAGHHAPEDRPEEIAAAVSAWADRHGLR